MNRLTYSSARLFLRLLGAVNRHCAFSRGTRVLMFHDIIDSRDTSDLYSLPAQVFAEGMTELSNLKDSSDRLFVPFTDTPQPGIAVTFDDGYLSTYRLAAQTLIELHIPFHLFVTRSFVESTDSRYLRVPDLQLLASLPGVTFGLHGTTHQPMSTMSSDALRRSLTDSRDWLEQTTQMTVDSLSYPHGATNSSVQDIVEEVGLSCAACSTAGTFIQPTQRYMIPRIDIWAMDSPRVLVDKARGVWDSILP